MASSFSRTAGELPVFSMPMAPSESPSTASHSPGWNVSLSGVGADAGHDIAVDVEGNVYVVGVRNGALELVKFDLDGVQQWSVVWSSTAGPASVAIGSPDCIVVAGSGKVCRFASNMSLVWSRTMSIAGGNIGVGVDAGDGIYLGYFSVSSFFGLNTIVLNLVKYTADGTKAWHEQDEVAEGFPVNPSVDLCVGPGGDVYMTSRLDVYAQTYSAVRRYTGVGNVLWERRIGLLGDYDVDSQSISMDDDGGVYVVGRRVSFDPTLRCEFVYKLNATGHYQWTRVMPGVTGVAALPMGDVLACGTGLDEVSNTTDVFLARYTPAGELRWTRSWGGTGNDGGRAITTAAIGDAYVTGYSTEPSGDQGDVLVVQFTTCSPTVPDPPTELRAIHGSGVVNLTWDAPFDGWAPILGYKLYWSIDNSSFTAVDVGARTMFSHVGLDNGKTYTYKVAALNVIGQGDNSSLVSTTPGIPMQVDNLVAVPGDRCVDLSWPCPSDGGEAITGYRLYWSTGGSGFEAINLGPMLAHHHGGLLAGQAYTYKVAALNAAGEGPASDIVVTTTWNVPEQVAGLVAVPGNRVINMSWSAPLDGGTTITEYHVYRCTGSSQDYVLVGTATATTYTDEGLLPGCTYRYKVGALNAVGAGILSASVTSTTWAVPLPPSIVVVPATPTTANSVWLTWDPVDGAHRYIIYRHSEPITEQNFELATAINMTTRPFTADVVPRTGKYYYAVVAANEVGTSGLSNIVEFVLLEPSADWIPVIAFYMSAAAALSGATMALVKRSRAREKRQ